MVGITTIVIGCSLGRVEVEVAIITERATTEHITARERLAETERELSGAEALAGSATAAELESAAAAATGARDAAQPQQE